MGPQRKVETEKREVDWEVGSVHSIVITTLKKNGSTIVRKTETIIPIQVSGNDADRLVLTITYLLSLYATKLG
jgi:hypothetical protein